MSIIDIYPFRLVMATEAFVLPNTYGRRTRLLILTETEKIVRFSGYWSYAKRNKSTPAEVLNIMKDRGYQQIHVFAAGGEEQEFLPFRWAAEKIGVEVIEMDIYKPKSDDPWLVFTYPE